LADERGTHGFASAFDEAAIRLALEQQLAEAGHHGGIDDTGDERER